jgi:hypothetical protein
MPNANTLTATINLYAPDDTPDEVGFLLAQAATFGLAAYVASGFNASYDVTVSGPAESVKAYFANFDEPWPPQ